VKLPGENNMRVGQTPDFLTRSRLFHLTGLSNEVMVSGNELD